MSAPSHLPTPEQIAAQAAAALVLLEMPFGTAEGFLVSDAAGRAGYLVTNLHAVAGAATIHAQLPDGQRVAVHSVAGLDARHDLALLRVPDVATPPLQGTSGLPREGARVFVPVRSGGKSRGPLDTRVRAVQQLGANFTALELGEPLPTDATGAPALDAAGRVVGVATAARREDEEVTLVILWRYVQAMLQAPRALPLAALARPAQRATRPREVPEHPLSLLEGCPLPALESIASTLSQATAWAPPPTTAATWRAACACTPRRPSSWCTSAPTARGRARPCRRASRAPPRSRTRTSAPGACATPSTGCSSRSSAGCRRAPRCRARAPRARARST